MNSEPCTLDGCGRPPETPAADPPEYQPDELVLWAVACGIKPDKGWHRLLNITADDLHGLVRRQPEQFRQLRLQHSLGEVITQRHLAQLLRARLAGMILKATAVKDLAEAVRIFEKLPGGAARPGGGTEAADPLDELGDAGLEAAVSEAKRLLSDLGGEEEG